jgi:hypothetical protein
MYYSQQCTSQHHSGTAFCWLFTIRGGVIMDRTSVPYVLLVHWTASFKVMLVRSTS